MTVDPSLAPETVIQLLRGVRGPRAVQTVRQYNMIMEYRWEQGCKCVHEYMITVVYRRTGVNRSINL